MKPILTAFVWVIFLSFLVGLAIGRLMEYLFYWDFWTGPIVVVSLAIFEAWLRARGLLAKRLGHRDQARVVTGNRSIPVMFESVLRGSGKSVDVPDDLYIACPSGEEISQADIKEFVFRAWSRQNRNRQGLSRAYWTRTARPAWSRERYEAMIDCLVEAGAIEARTAGRAGRLIGSYDQIIKQLRGEK